MKTKLEFEDTNGEEERRMLMLFRADDMHTALKAIWAVTVIDKSISHERLYDLLHSLELVHLVS